MSTISPAASSVSNSVVVPAKPAALSASSAVTSALSNDVARALKSMGLGAYTSSSAVTNFVARLSKDALDAAEKNASSDKPAAGSPAGASLGRERTSDTVVITATPRPVTGNQGGGSSSTLDATASDSKGATGAMKQLRAAAVQAAALANSTLERILSGGSDSAVRALETTEESLHTLVSGIVGARAAAGPANFAPPAPAAGATNDDAGLAQYPALRASRDSAAA